MGEINLLQTNNENRVKVLKKLGYDLDDEGYIIKGDTKKEVICKYGGERVHINTAAILPGSVIVINANPVTMAEYFMDVVNKDEWELGEFAFGFLKGILKESKRNAKNYLIKNKVGFLPEGMDYSEYQKIKNNTLFKQLKFLIGDHPTLSIILTGIYLSSLDRDLKKKIAEENRQRIYDKYKAKGVSIMNMATTGFIEQYVKWLSKYNVEKNPSQKELIDFYEKILEDWTERSIFIQGHLHDKAISSKITSKMNLGKEVFFVFACEKAIINVRNSLKLIDRNVHRYKIITEIINNNPSERVWIFEKI